MYTGRRRRAYRRKDLRGQHEAPENEQSRGNKYQTSESEKFPTRQLLVTENSS